MANRWMQKESKREAHAGTKGSFTRIAESHGHSVPEEAELDKHKSGKVGAQGEDGARVFESEALRWRGQRTIQYHSTFQRSRVRAAW